VEGKGDGLYGDGFAVWLTKERAIMGPVFGNKDEFEGLGIFFDTYANSRQSVSLFLYPFSFGC
jgi:mannose-binding lectin 2